MRKIWTTVAGLGIAAGALLLGASPASAHVHAFTPLGCLTTDSPNAGATVGFDRASDAAAPLNGPTPIVPENASGVRPGGGQGAENACG